MLIFFLISIVFSQNIIKNPSFEEVDSNNKLLDWYNPDNVEISTVSHSEKNLYILNLYLINIYLLPRGLMLKKALYMKCVLMLSF